MGFLKKALIYKGLKNIREQREALEKEEAEGEDFVKDEIEKSNKRLEKKMHDDDAKSMDEYIEKRNKKKRKQEGY